MEQTVVLAAKDSAVVDAVEASALAAGVELRVVTESGELAHIWRDAGLRLVAPEMVGRVLRLPVTPRTYVIGREPTTLTDASVELGQPVLRLPDTSGRLAEVLARLKQPTKQGRVIALMGASGGLGISTIAVGLALAAAHQGLRSSVVELATHGGGIDLLLGAEAEAGARWPELAGASGQLGDVAELLVQAHGVAVLAASRELPSEPDPRALRSVLGSLTRTMDAVLLDAGKVTDVEADVTALMVAADVRGVAAARSFCAGRKLVPTGLIVRSGHGRSLSPKAVADALGAPLLGVVRDDPAVPRLGELGQSPSAAPARRFRRETRKLWSVIWDA